LHVNLGAINEHPKNRKRRLGAQYCCSGVANFYKTFLSSSLLRWINADEFSGATFVFKLNDAIDQ
jgi:hypothetical protein